MLRSLVQAVRSRVAVAITLICAVLIGTTVLVAATFDRPQNRAAAPTIPAARGHREPSAVDLTRQWAAYGGRATCSDWSGADGMQAVSLGAGKIAWFFADTYLGPIDRTDPNAEFSKVLINNSLVIESNQGGKISRSTITGGGACPWDRLPGGEAQPLVRPQKKGHWYWGGDGIRVGDRVVKFFNRYRGGGARYVPLGTAVTTFPVDELTRTPPTRVARPTPQELPRVVPNPGGSPIMWGSAVYEPPDSKKSLVYVYGWHVRDINDQRKRMYLARVPKKRITDFAAWRFYAGPGTWSPRQVNAQPVQPPGQEFAVSTGWSVINLNGRHWLIQHEPGLDDPDIVAYPAQRPWGPFDRAQRLVLHRASNIGRTAANAFRIIYEARVIPALSTGRTLVIGYNLNTTAVSLGCRSLSNYTDEIYRPQFLTVPTADIPRRGATPRTPRVTSGASTTPPGGALVNRNPSQWYDAWLYPIGQCPPLPRIPAAVATPRPDGTVVLNWPKVGPDISYRIYHREAGGKFFLARTQVVAGSTLRGYARGKSYEWRVVPMNVKSQEGPATTATARIP